MKKVYLLEIIFMLWLVVLILMLVLPLTANAHNSNENKESTVNAPMIAFTFDDGPNVAQTKRLLDGLNERGAKATFFIVGELIDYDSGKANVEERRKLVERMALEGHTVGNHTYSHCWLNKVSHEKAAWEIKKTNDLIEEITGSKVQYLRPPGGSALMAPWVRKIASPMITVCWGYCDVRDWECHNVDKMVKKILDNAIDGDIVLLHDNYATSVDTALQAIDILKERGFRFVTVDELLKRNTGSGLELDPMRIYFTMAEGDTSRLKKSA